MDPLNPIVPASDLTPRIPRAPAVPRVGPDQQRQQARDDEASEQEPDRRDFDDSLDDATSEQFSLPDEISIPAVKRFKPKPVAESAAEERRTYEDEDDDDAPSGPHIDIIA